MLDLVSRAQYRLRPTCLVLLEYLCVSILIISTAVVQEDPDRESGAGRPRGRWLGEEADEVERLQIIVPGRDAQIGQRRASSSLEDGSERDAVATPG